MKAHQFRTTTFTHYSTRIKETVFLLQERKKERGNGESSEAMESRVCKVIKIVMQDLQDTNWKRDSEAGEDGPGHSIRRFHACKFLSLSLSTLWESVLNVYWQSPNPFFFPVLFSWQCGFCVFLLFSCLGHVHPPFLVLLCFISPRFWCVLFILVLAPRPALWFFQGDSAFLCSFWCPLWWIVCTFYGPLILLISYYCLNSSHWIFHVYYRIVCKDHILVWFYATWLKFGSGTRCGTMLPAS